MEERENEIGKSLIQSFVDIKKSLIKKKKLKK